MKKITISRVKTFFHADNYEKKTTSIQATGEEDMEASDGYHTFGQLYEHRIRLFIALCKQLSNYNCQYCEPAFGKKENPVWCATQHSDHVMYDGWFILGINKEKGKQITYHLPARYWNEVCEFAEVLERAPEWDGHTSADVIERLKTL